MRAAIGPLEAPLDTELLGPQGPEIVRLFTRPFLLLHRVSAMYTARTCLLLLFDLGWEARLRAGTTLAALCAELPAQARKPLAWMLPFLATEHLLEREGDSFTLRGEPDLDLVGLREAVEFEAPGHGPNFDLLDGVRAHPALLHRRQGGRGAALRPLPLPAVAHLFPQREPRLLPQQPGGRRKAGFTALPTIASRMWRPPFCAGPSGI
ncbi:MAG: hypothetical protein IPP58_15025 [Holophagaceae bacterium]|uniref:Uncharacterized protein n=1 Tax=Candidatus Geothrix skivensis TaxID=2954439 RepID=A0A9D7SHY0_9BACT|nr:hypothetical protein [Candidatus Geothrix skivensis]